MDTEGNLTPLARGMSALVSDGYQAGKDAINAFVREEKMVKRSDKINLQLAPGGGYFMRLKMINKK